MFNKDHSVRTCQIETKSADLMKQVRKKLINTSQHMNVKVQIVPELLTKGHQWKDHY